jgi:hypothetical protein
MGKREQHQVAYAVLKLEDAHDELQAAVGETSQRGGRARELPDIFATQAGALKLIEDVMERLDRDAAALPGLPVSEAAKYLDVSEPTIRLWLDRGVLRKVPGFKPLLLERSSLRAAHRAVNDLRARGQDSDWLRALVDLLHDRIERNSADVRRGLEEMERGELEPA